MAARKRVAGLVLIAALLVWLNLRPPVDVDVVSLSDRSLALTNDSSEPISSTESTQSPSSIDRPPLEPAANDPFDLTLPKPNVAIRSVPTTPAPVVAMQTPPPPPPPPAAPPLNMTFAGRMTAPDGIQMVYVTYGDTSISLTTGQTLPNGYRVEAITARAVQLSYPPLNTTARIDLPEPPKYEIR